MGILFFKNENLVIFEFICLSSGITKFLLIMKQFFYFIALVFIFSSCGSSKVFVPSSYVSKEKITFFGIKNEMLKKSQFFSDTAQEIVLKPITPEKGSALLLEDGTINLAKYSQDSVKILPKTPGVVKEIMQGSNKETLLKVSFDDSGNFLVFGPDGTEEGIFTLYVKDDNRVKYGNLEYEVVSGGGAILYFASFYMEKQALAKVLQGKKIKNKS